MKTLGHFYLLEHICSLYKVSQQGEQAKDRRYLCGQPHLSHRRGHPLSGQTLRPGGPIPPGLHGANPEESLSWSGSHLVPEVRDKGQEQGGNEVKKHTFCCFLK